MYFPLSECLVLLLLLVVVVEVVVVVCLFCFSHLTVYQENT